MDFYLLKQLGINHSCYPNTVLGVDNKLITIQPIPKGQAVTIDYATISNADLIIKNCQCGYNGCRKTIKGYPSLPVFFREKYEKAGACLPVMPAQPTKNK